MLRKKLVRQPLASRKFFQLVNLSENEEVQNLIWEEIQKANEYTSSLQIRKFRMLTKELDHEDGDLTATQKAKRNVIMDKFSDLIEEMYK